MDCEQEPHWQSHGSDSHDLDPDADEEDCLFGYRGEDSSSAVAATSKAAASTQQQRAIEQQAILKAIK